MVLCSLLCFCAVVLLSELIQLHSGVLWLWIVGRPSQALTLTLTLPLTLTLTLTPTPTLTLTLTLTLARPCR